MANNSIGDGIGSMDPASLAQLAAVSPQMAAMLAQFGYKPHFMEGPGEIKNVGDGIMSATSSITNGMKERWARDAKMKKAARSLVEIAK